MPPTASKPRARTPVTGRGNVTAAPRRAPRVRKQVLASATAAKPIGPYSQGIKAGPFVFVAGEKGVDVRTGNLVPGGIVAETRQTLENIRAILSEAGATLGDAVSATVHMTDLREFAQMNEVFARYFGEAPPGRTTVQVSALPGGARIEITVVAMVPS